MTEATLEEGTAKVRRQLAELDQGISAMHKEIRRLTDSAHKRDSLIQLERAAEAKAAARAAEAKAAAEAERVARAHAERAAHLEPPSPTRPASADPGTAAGDADGAGPRPAVVKRRIPPQPMVLASEATPPLVEAAAPAPAPEPVGPTVHSTVPGGPNGGFFDDVDPAGSTEPEQSPLNELDDDIEAAFDRFFSAEVEAEPSQQWLLND